LPLSFDNGNLKARASAASFPDWRGAKRYQCNLTCLRRQHIAEQLVKDQPQQGNNSAENDSRAGRSPATSSSNRWFGIEAIAGVGVTSEVDGAPVENGLYPNRETGWRAGKPCPQIIRITFSGPTNIRRIQFVFRESQFESTQEFTLCCSLAAGQRREGIRQQWTLSPQGSTEEVEDYGVTLDDVVVLNSQSLLRLATEARMRHCFVCASVSARTTKVIAARRPHL